MPSREELHQRILNVFTETLGVHVPSVETDLIEEGIMDSLLFVDFVMSLEQEFGIVISLADLEIDEFRCVSSIGALVLGRLGRMANTSEQKAVSQ